MLKMMISEFRGLSYRQQQERQANRMHCKARRGKKRPFEASAPSSSAGETEQQEPVEPVGGVFSDLVPTQKQTKRIPDQQPPNADCPTTWKGLVGNYQSHQALKRVASAKTLNGCVWVVWGATGSGKSCAVYLACKNRAWMHTLQNIGEPYLDRLEKFVRASRRHFKREVVVIDPLEEVVRGPGCVKKLCSIMRLSEDRNTGLGFLIVCDNVYHRPFWPLRSNREMNKLCVKTLRFWPLRPDNVKKILIRFGVSTTKRLADGISVSNGDGRRAVQFAKYGSHAGDCTINRFQACDALVDRRVADAYRVESPKDFVRFLTLNAPSMCGNDMDLCARMADIASDGDCLGRNGVHFDMLARVNGLSKIPRGKALHRGEDDPVHQQHVRRACRMFSCPATDLPCVVLQTKKNIASDPFRVRTMRVLSQKFEKWDVPASVVHDLASKPRFKKD